MTTRVAKVLWRLEAFLRDLRRGILHGYPFCCVLNFALGTFFRVDAQAARRGCVKRSKTSTYVTCRWHQGRHPQWVPYHRPYKPYVWEQLRLW